MGALTKKIYRFFDARCLPATPTARDIFEKVTFVIFCLPVENLKKSSIDPLKLSVINLKNENITGKKKNPMKTKFGTQGIKNPLYRLIFCVMLTKYRFQFFFKQHF